MKSNFKQFDRSSRYQSRNQNRSNSGVNDKLFNLTAIFFVVPFLSYLLLGAPLSIYQNFTSFGILFLSIGAVIMNLILEIFGNKVAKKTLVASLYGLIFIFIVQYILVPVMNYVVLITMALFFVIYAISFFVNIILYRFLSYRLKKLFIVRFVVSFLVSQFILFFGLLLVNKYLTLNTFILADISFEAYIRLAILLIGSVVVFALSKIFRNNNYQGNNNNRSYNNNRFNNQVDKNEKYNADNAKSTRPSKKDGSFKGRNEENRVQ